MTQRRSFSIMNKHKITAYLFLFFLISPLMTATFWGAKMGLGLLFNRYENVQLSVIVKEFSQGKFDHLKWGRDNNPVFFVDFRQLMKIIEGKPNLSHFVNYHGFIQCLLDKRWIPEADPTRSVFKLNNGHLTWVIEETDVTPYVENIFELERFLKNREIDLIYVQAPCTISKFDSQLSEGVVDFSNKNADEFLERIRGKIEFIDLRQKMHDEGINLYDQFFQTDHHWIPECGFWAFCQIAEKLRNDHGVMFDPQYLDLQHYGVRVYKNWFLGTLGKRTGQYYAGTDDISLILPKFETDLATEIWHGPHSSTCRSGTFEDNFIFYKKLYPRSFFELNPYLLYSGGNVPKLTITNHLAENSKKILLLRESFSHVVSPFLALMCKELNIIDLRLYRETTILDFIEQTKPDIVVLLYHPGVYTNKSFFTFDTIVGDVGLE